MWPEVENAKSEKKRELSLTGSTFTKRIQENGLDPTIFTLLHLNFLNISETVLEIIPNEISNLENLQSLLMFGNKIKALPPTISKLSNLKVLDLSRNCIEKFPEEISTMTKLVSINMSNNAVETVPKCCIVTLKSIDFSNNKLSTFPDICYSEMNQLAEVQLHGNKIENIPENICELPALKCLDLSSNLIKNIPKTLANLSKLKDLNLKENALSDKRLFKLVDQCRTKQILDYVKQHGVVSSNTNAKQTSGKDKSQSKSAKTEEQNDKVNVVRAHKIKILRAPEEGFKVQYSEEVRALRPYIFCCIVKNIDLKNDNKLRRFLQAQSRLHDTVCLKREGATIATHDANKIKGNVVEYTAIHPKKLFITPLGQSNPVTGECLFLKLRQEAENLRKEKKRNVYSGIHKYLYLLEGKDKFACMVNSLDEVISVPPLTNSDITKMSEDTKELFLEVTSSSSANTCRQAMQALIKEILVLGLADSDENNLEHFHNMVIQQVKVVDPEGNLRNVYPSRSDLVFEGESIVIERE